MSLFWRHSWVIRLEVVEVLSIDTIAPMEEPGRGNKEEKSLCDVM